MLIVNVEEYGDFDMPFTKSTWVSMEYDNLSQTGLSDSLFANDRGSDNAEHALKQLGFTKAKDAKIRVGGNL